MKINILFLVLRNKKKSAKKTKATKFMGHIDAVLSLDWNHNREHILASGGADSQIVLWDLEEAKAAEKFDFDGMVFYFRSKKIAIKRLQPNF